MIDTLMRMVLVFGTLSLLGLGGGKGIVPQMHADAVQQYHWVTSEQFTQFYTIGKLVPGPTTIFSALVGYTAAGVVGAAVATSAMFIPSSLLVIGMGLAWKQFSRTRWKNIVSLAMAPVVIGLIWSSVFALGKGAFTGPWMFAIAGLVGVLTYWTKITAPKLILLGAVIGLVVLH
jgi:chromate transporter